MLVDVVEDVRENEGDLAEINWTLQQFNIDELTDYYKNPRSLSDKEFKQLKTSLDKFGMIDKPIVNADSAHTIIGGHQRKHVLESTGVKEIECWIPDRELSDKEVEELNIRLNKNTGSWDFDVLANEFELDDLLEWGFDKGELDLDLWAEDAPEDVEPQIDKADELQEKWNVQVGQVWQLGEHRLICGDCTDRAVVERLLGDNKCVVLSDPPYGIDVIDKQKLKGTIGGGGKVSGGKFIPATEYSPVIGDDTTDIAELFYNLCVEKGFENIILWGGNYFTEFLPPRACWIVWDKRESLGSNNFADCEMAWTSFKSPARIYRQMWSGAFRAGKRDVEGKHRVHPTQKPVGIHEEILRDFTVDTDLIFDGFLGSGTTLIACERLGRKCRAVEISPAYVAVAIQRWVDVTGKEPMLLTL